MKLYTTINICNEDRIMIGKTATLLGITKSVLISTLVHYAGRKFKRCPDIGNRILYQQKQPGDEWRRLHLSLQGDEYEYCIDLRKVFKMSVSCFIAYAIKHYLDDLIKIINKGSDNYRYRNYAMMIFNLKDVLCYLYYWGIPPILVAPTDKSIE